MAGIRMPQGGVAFLSLSMKRPRAGQLAGTRYGSVEAPHIDGMFAPPPDGNLPTSRASQLGVCPPGGVRSRFAALPLLSWQAPCVVQAWVMNTASMVPQPFGG